MKKIILLAMSIVFAFSCSKKETNNEKKDDEKKVDVKVEKKVEKKDDVEKKVDTEKKNDAKVDVKMENKVDSNTSDSERLKIVNFAKTFEDKTIPESSKWNKYASGFLQMIYLNFGVNLTDIENKKDEEGKWLSTTEMIYNYIKENGELFSDKTPKKGDIVFLDNTYDSDKNGEFNDKLTSIGIIVDIDSDETIYFLYNTSKGVKLRMMNLKHPEQEDVKNKNVTKTINSKMRWLNKKEKEKDTENKYELSSQLLNSFGSIFK